MLRTAVIVIPDGPLVAFAIVSVVALLIAILALPPVWRRAGRLTNGARAWSRERWTQAQRSRDLSFSEPLWEVTDLSNGSFRVTNNGRTSVRVVAFGDKRYDTEDNPAVDIRPRASEDMRSNVTKDIPIEWTQRGDRHGLHLWNPAQWQRRPQSDVIHQIRRTKDIVTEAFGPAPRGSWSLGQTSEPAEG